MTINESRTIKIEFTEVEKGALIHVRQIATSLLRHLQNEGYDVMTSAETGECIDVADLCRLNGVIDGLMTAGSYWEVE